MEMNKRIVSFKDLEVYQNTYEAMLKVTSSIIPYLPQNERFDLVDQINRASKSIPRLIAEGYAKRHQKSGFQKYLDDAMGECNEMVVSLSQCRDIYYRCVDIRLCDALIDVYDKSGRQLYKLRMAWEKFKTVQPNRTTKRAA